MQYMDPGQQYQEQQQMYLYAQQQQEALELAYPEPAYSLPRISELFMDLTCINQSSLDYMEAQQTQALQRLGLMHNMLYVQVVEDEMGDGVEQAYTR